MALLIDSSTEHLQRDKGQLSEPQRLLGGRQSSPPEQEVSRSTVSGHISYWPPRRYSSELNENLLGRFIPKKVISEQEGDKYRALPLASLITSLMTLGKVLNFSMK